MKQTRARGLQLEVGYVDSYPCIRMTGEGDQAGACSLGETLERLIGDGDTRVVLDTRDVRFLDLNCYQVIEAVLQRLEEEGGLLVLVDQSLPVERTLKLLDLAQTVHVVPGVRQATAYLDGHD